MIGMFEHSHIILIFEHISSSTSENKIFKHQVNGIIPVNDFDINIVSSLNCFTTESGR